MASTSAKRLAHQQSANQVVRTAMRRLAKKATDTLEGLYLDADDPKRNPDADKNWSDCSMKTRAALILAKEAAAEVQSEGARPLALVFVSQRVDSATDWEAMASKVDQDERARTSIDAEVVDETKTG